MTVKILSPGSAFGRYRIESRLGQGGVGIVYLATDPHLQRKVALKVLHPTLAAEPDFRARFIAEARAAAVDHPHVLPIYEAGEENGLLFLAMRYVPGFDLGTVIAREGALSPERAVTLLGQIGDALDAAHAVGLVHRDVKPQNVLVGPGDYAYLADFGLARTATPYTTQVTQPGVFVGTVDYLAPELLTADGATPRSDLYAFACLAFECLTGAPPFRRADEMATLYAHAHEPVPKLTTSAPNLPLVLNDVFAHALAKRPEDRYASAAKFAMEIASAVSGRQQATSVVGAAPDHKKPRRLRLGFVAVTAFVSVASLAAIALVGGAVDLAAFGTPLRSTPSQPSASASPSTSAEPPSPTPSPTPTIKLVSVAAGQLILPASEFPDPGYKIVGIDSGSATGWTRRFTASTPESYGTTVDLRVLVFRSVADATYAVVLAYGECLPRSPNETGRELPAAAIGDAIHVCVYKQGNTFFSTTVMVYASSRNVEVTGTVSIDPQASPTATGDVLVRVARAQFAYIDRIDPP